MRKFKIIAAVLFLAISEPSRSEAGDQHGYQIIENPQGIQMHVLHLGQSSSKLCKKINETFYKGILLDCPKCKLIGSICSSSLPGFTTALVKKEKAIFPYIHFGEHGDHRQWWIGLDRNSANAVCNETAQRYSKIGLLATCVE